VPAHDLVPWLRGPAPYPPEWQWRYRPHALAKAAAGDSDRPRLVGLLAWSGSALARRAPAGCRAAALIIGGGLLGFAWAALLQSEDGGAVAFLVRHHEPGLLLVPRGRSLRPAQDLRTLLREYPQRLPTLPEPRRHASPGPSLSIAA